MACVSCGGRLGWVDGDEGQWVACLHCQEGRDKFEQGKKNLEETQRACEEKTRRLMVELGIRYGTGRLAEESEGA